MPRIAILSCGGRLPGLLATAHPDALTVTFAGAPADLPGPAGLEAEFERLGALFDALRADGVAEVVLAGGLSRPSLDPSRLDEKTRLLAPRLMSAMGGGDDGLLRVAIEALEEEGFAVRGAHELLSSLTAAPGLLAGPEPTGSDLADAERAREILDALGPLDIGQGAVVAGGICLGIETIQGTDALLRFVAGTSPERRPAARGALAKAPKPGQDLRVDMPAIGPDTVERAAEAGLAGIAFAAGRTLLIDREKACAEAEAAGLFLHAEAWPG